jgi:hypothetical protein
MQPASLAYTARCIPPLSALWVADRHTCTAAPYMDATINMWTSSIQSTRRRRKFSFHDQVFLIVIFLIKGRKKLLKALWLQICRLMLSIPHSGFCREGSHSVQNLDDVYPLMDAFTHWQTRFWHFSSSALNLQASCARRHSNLQFNQQPHHPHANDLWKCSLLSLEARCVNLRVLKQRKIWILESRD